MGETPPPKVTSSGSYVDWLSWLFDLGSDPPAGTQGTFYFSCTSTNSSGKLLALAAEGGECGLSESLGGNEYFGPTISVEIGPFPLTDRRCGLTLEVLSESGSQTFASASGPNAQVLLFVEPE
jgi:hypothetical protein